MPNLGKKGKKVLGGEADVSAQAIVRQHERETKEGKKLGPLASPFFAP